MMLRCQYSHRCLNVDRIEGLFNHGVVGMKDTDMMPVFSSWWGIESIEVTITL
jgi:hypothetical protein